MGVIVRQLSAALQQAMLFALCAYRRWISPLLPPACRFHPSCAEYAAESIRVHGPVRGAALAARRVCRCHPLTAGGVDPVPSRSEARRDRGSVSDAVPVEGAR